MNTLNSNFNIDFSAANFKVEDYCNSITNDFTHWLDNTYKSANEALYGILARCYALSLAYANNSTVAAKVEKRLEDLEVPKRSKPNPHGRVLNLVFFGPDYIKRRSVYSKAMTKAQGAGVKPNDLTAWLFQHGGLEAQGHSPRTPKKELEARKADYQTKGCKAVIDRKATSQTVITDLPIDKAVNGVLVVVCKIDGNSVVPVAVVDDDKPMDAVLKWASEKLAA